MLLHVILHVESEDSWKWTPDPVVGYTVSGAYRVLTSRPPPHYSCSGGSDMEEGCSFEGLSVRVAYFSE